MAFIALLMKNMIQTNNYVFEGVVAISYHISLFNEIIAFMGIVLVNLEVCFK